MIASEPGAREAVAVIWQAMVWGSGDCSSPNTCPKKG